jgi:hypothetical protein
VRVLVALPVLALLTAVPIAAGVRQDAPRPADERGASAWRPSCARSATSVGKSRSFGRAGGPANADWMDRHAVFRATRLAKDHPGLAL